MTDFFTRYGIKEVADVSFTEVGAPEGSFPALFLDTLKVSSLEQTGEEASAQGGQGNSKLITWDYGKEVVLQIEDALMSQASMNMLFGGAKEATALGAEEKVTRTRFVSGANRDALLKAMTNTGEQTPDADDVTFYTEDGVEVTGTIDSKKTYLGIWTGIAEDGSNVVNIDANTFPGVYKIVGETFIRDEDGHDNPYQFIIERGKIGIENTITLEAEGDPTVFNFSITALRGKGKNMVKLVKYNFAPEPEDDGTGEG